MSIVDALDQHIKNFFNALPATQDITKAAKAVGESAVSTAKEFGSAFNPSELPTGIKQTGQDLARDVAYTATGGKTDSGGSSASTSPSVSPNGGSITNVNKKEVTNTSTGPDLQQWLNHQLGPIETQMGQAVKEYQDYTKSGVPSYVPKSVAGAISNFQTLTGKALAGIIPAQNAADKQAVSASQANSILQLLPSSLIYHAMYGQLPGASNSGVQDLWKIFENVNLGIPADSSDVQQTQAFLNQLTPTTNPTSANSSSTTGG